MKIRAIKQQNTPLASTYEFLTCSTDQNSSLNTDILLHKCAEVQNIMFFSLILNATECIVPSQGLGASPVCGRNYVAQQLAIVQGYVSQCFSQSRSLLPQFQYTTGLH